MLRSWAQSSSAAEIKLQSGVYRSVSEQKITSPVAADHVPDELFEDSSVLDLFPTVVRTINPEEYNIVRIGAPLLTAISTTSIGLEAVRLLGRGHTIAEVKSALTKKYDSEATDLKPLILALYKARIVRRAGGVVICHEKVSATRALLQKCKWAGYSSRRALMSGLLKSLPLAAAYQILYVLRPRWSRAKQSQVFRQVRQNVDEVFGSSLRLPQRDRIARDFVSELILRDLDMEVLNAFSDFQVAQWIRRSCTISGKQHLDAALEKNKGVLLASFHFSSAHLIILVLWLNGYSFTGAGGITRAAGTRVLPFDNPELEARLGGCGKVKWFSHFNFDSVLGIRKALERGEMALVYPDSLWTRPAKQVAKYFGHNAAQYRPARISVPFLGRMAEANKGVPWLYQQSGAPFIPLKLTRTAKHRFHLSIGPELELPRKASVEAITGELYRALEREVCIDPASWSYLQVLHKFLVSSNPESCTTMTRESGQLS